jgi:glycosyltransferase involved in cell wall biosynthesis
MVSVIIPNYNHSQYLIERLDSVFKQTYQSIEIIILDDGSSDNSVEIIQKYAEKYSNKITKIEFNKRNSGSPFAQWAKGIMMATGEYIWIAESDDFSDTNFLHKCIEIMSIQENLTCVFSNSKLIYGNQLSDNFRRLNPSEIPEGIYTGLEVIAGWRLGHALPFIGNTSSALIRREHIFDNVDLNRLSLFRYAGDIFFWLTILKSGTAYYMAKELNYFRQHESNTSIKKFLKLNTVFRNALENIITAFLIFQLYPISNKDKSALLSFSLRMVNQYRNRSQNYLNKAIGLMLLLFTYLLFILPKPIIRIIPNPTYILKVFNSRLS